VSVKRVHYFDHQFLKEQDFHAEQAYHREMRHRHNRLLHGWGVVEGLEIKHKGREVTIEPGMAIDKEGREIVLFKPATREVSSLDSPFYLALGYKDAYEESDRHRSGGIDDYIRVTESHEIEERKEEPRDGSVIVLARVHMNKNGHIERVESNVRTLLATRGSAVGWVRLPFKPMRLEALRVGEKLAPPREWDPSIEFIVDVASAYCGEKGGRGTMHVPVPPGAARVTDFRICGTTRRKVEFELVRTGWNIQARKGEHKIILKRSVEGKEWFDEQVRVEEEELRHLTESQALSISVVAEGITEIWLIGARFE
jgi:hypothetical protein